MGLATKKAVDNNSVAPLVSGGAIQARQTIVGRWSPRPVLQQEARVITPLSYGEGMGVGLFIWLLEDGARRPLSYYIITFGYTLLLPLFYCIIATGSVVMAKFMWVCFEGL